MLSAIKILVFLTLCIQHVSALSLSVPPGDVVAGAVVHCEWTATASDPSEFVLVMQFGDWFSEDLQTNIVVTAVNRGTIMSGAVNADGNSHIISRHRLAAFSKPFNTSLIGPGDPLAVSSFFEVIAGPAFVFR
ncbi:hypothetical protein C8J56DRAFT_414514 [Mycena floridula]|nr:hypothetical protein C8J56DRAFT_414514 [Mycena floridula]